MLCTLGLAAFFVSFREEFPEYYFSGDLLGMHGVGDAECLSTHTRNMSLCCDLNESLAGLQLNSGRSVSLSLKTPQL